MVVFNHAMIFIVQNVVRDLKLHFNAAFDELYEEKGNVLVEIRGWIASLDAIVDATDGQERSAYAAKDFERTPLENPELDLPEQEGSDVAKVGFC